MRFLILVREILPYVQPQGLGVEGEVLVVSIINQTLCIGLLFPNISEHPCDTVQNPCIFLHSGGFLFLHYVALIMISLQKPKLLSLARIFSLRVVTFIGVFLVGRIADKRVEGGTEGAVGAGGLEVHLLLSYK